MLAIFVITVGGLSVFEREDAINDWFELVHGDSTVHGEKLGATACSNAAQRDDACDGGAENIEGRNLARGSISGERPDQRNLPRKPGRLDRLLDRAGATDLDHQIDASTTSQIAHRQVPIWRRAVIDYIVGPQSLEPLCLLLARRSRNDTRTKKFSELKCAERNASRSQGEHCITGLKWSTACEGTPGGDADEGQCCGFFEGKWQTEVWLETTLEEVLRQTRFPKALFEEVDKGVILRVDVEDLPWMARFLAGLGVPLIIHHPSELRTVLHHYALTMASYAERIET
jgi:hypothetical protein